MLVQIYWISLGQSGRLGIMPRPRGNDWLEDEVESLKMSGVDLIVSLLEYDKINELGLVEEQAFCEANGIEFINFPIRDRSVPASRKVFLELATRLATCVAEGKSVVVHCRQGVGRSSLLAACVLCLHGSSADEAFEEIQDARGCAVPDTEEQREWLKAISD
jgi:protein-tyrosine phosphatase